MSTDDTPDYETLSAIGDSPDQWDSLPAEHFQHVVFIKCLEYGISSDATRIPLLLSLYRHYVEQVEVGKRMELCQALTEEIEKQRGAGYMSLMAMIHAETEGAIMSTAAMNLAVLHPADDGNPLAGPEFVVRSLMDNPERRASDGNVLSGILLLGDKRLIPLLESAWEILTDDARIELVAAKSGFAMEGGVEFYLRCLEQGCSESVFGAIIAAIVKIPVVSLMPQMVDVERVLPAYENIDNPIRAVRKVSFENYLTEIRPRLAAIEASETEPKLTPKIYKVWQNPEAFKGIIG